MSHQCVYVRPCVWLCVCVCLRCQSEACCITSKASALNIVLLAHKYPIKFEWPCHCQYNTTCPYFPAPSHDVGSEVTKRPLPYVLMHFVSGRLVSENLDPPGALLIQLDPLEFTWRCFDSKWTTWIRLHL
jgi:hypothetical protein